MRIFKVKPLVSKLLLQKRDLQQDDYRLISNVWYKQLSTMGYNPSTISAVKLLELYSQGKLAPAESIRRTRQLLQQHEPNKYGKNRKRGEMEQEVKREVLIQKSLYSNP